MVERAGGETGVEVVMFASVWSEALIFFNTRAYAECCDRCTGKIRLGLESRKLRRVGFDEMTTIQGPVEVGHGKAPAG